MPKIEQENLNKLSQALFAMDDYAVSKEDFLRQFKRLLEFLKRMKARNSEEVTSLKQNIADLSEKLKGDNYNEITSHKSEINELFNSLSSELRKIADDKITSIRDGIDGKDADEDRVSIVASERAIEAVTPLIPTTKGIKKQLLTMGKTLRKALNKKLRIKDIKNLQKELDELKKRPIMTGGGGASGGGHVRAVDISASLDGATRTFALSAFWRIVSVHLSSFPNILRPTTDFTWDASAMTITFTSEIPLNSISAGQTCLVVIAEP